MNVIAWNYQGTGADLTKGHLEKLHRCFRPSFLFLFEIKNSRQFLQDLQVSFGYDYVCTVEPRRRSRGVALIYMGEPKTVISYSDNHMIDVESSLKGHKIFMSFVYGDSVVERRHKVWKRLTRINLNQNGAWF